LIPYYTELNAAISYWPNKHCNWINAAKVGNHTITITIKDLQYWTAALNSEHNKMI